LSATSWLRVIGAGLQKNLKTSVTYPSWLLSRVTGPIIWVSISIFSYTALVPEAQIQDAFERAGTSASFTGFLILGQTVFSVFSNLNFRGGMAIQRERWQGTLEIIMLAPTSRVAFILSESLFGLIDGGWTILLALVVTSIAFGADFALPHPGLGAAAIALTLASMVALSVFFAAFYVLTRSAGPLSFAIQSPIRFLTGTNFPVSALPGALQVVSYALPMTWGLVAIRAAFLGDSSWAQLEGTLLALGAFTVVFFALGWWLIGVMERLSKERGTLHQY
jgi:ABC-2 type transport system permease protein